MFAYPPFVPYPFAATRHGPVQPALLGGADPQRHPVVVVGGGPVGYCAALGLLRQGVPVVVLETDDSVCLGSRAICVSRRSLQIMQSLGALEGFLNIGLPWTGGRSFYRETEVLHFKMPQDQNQKLPPMLNMAQYSIEQILLDALVAAGKEQPGLLQIRWQNKLTSLTLEDEGAVLTVDTPLGSYSLQADWVVAADGGRSAVRVALGLALQGTTYEGRYVIVDILMKSARSTERLAYFDPPCNPVSTVLVHKQPNDVWRIDYQLQEGEDPEAAILPENVLPRVQSLLAMTGETAPWNPIWMGIYKANALTLEHYRHGRVLLAGDAAHLLPIFGVRGLNSGLDDAHNLAWKLAYVIKGLAGDKLLDSYSQERVAAAHENLAHSRKSTEFMAPPSFAFDLMRTAVLSLAAAHPGVRSLINPRQTSAISYAHSPLNAGAGPTALALSSVAFTAGPVPGEVVPECPLTRFVEAHDSVGAGNLGMEYEGYFTDLLKPHFCAFVFAEDAHLPNEWQVLIDTMARRQLPFQLTALTHTSGQPGQRGQSGIAARAWDHTGRLFPLFGAVPGTLYVVRPDGHVLGRWLQAQTPAQVQQVVDEALAAIEHALAA